MSTGPTWDCGYAEPTSRMHTSAASVAHTVGEMLAPGLDPSGTPVRITIFTALVVAVLAGFIPLGELAALANAGTLAAFTAVSICMMIMRVRAPDAPRTFRAPMPWVIGGIAVFGCIYLFLSLPAQTQLWFLVWNALGLGVYFIYTRRHAVVG